MLRIMCCMAVDKIFSIGFEFNCNMVPTYSSRFDYVILQVKSVFLNKIIKEYFI
jgi:hypothetical protein